MKKISIAIMMHPRRMQYLHYLSQKLQTAKVAIDKYNSIWDTARRAWLMYDKDADYHFVIQDDSIVTSNFINKLQNHVDSQLKDFCYVLYAGRPRLQKHIKRAKQENLDHLIFKRIYNEVALGLPTSHIEAMVKFCDENQAPNCRWIQRYIQSQKLLAYYPMPSLINHRDESTLHTNNKGNYERTANWFES